MFIKFIKHAGFVLAGAAVSALIGILQGDSAFLAFLAAHPIVSFIVPFVAGLLGSLSKWLDERALERRRAARRD